MIHLIIPGQEDLFIENIVFDLNGTLAVDGSILPENIILLSKLQKKVAVYIITAGTHGNLETLQEKTGINIIKIHPGREAEQKLELIRQLNQDKTASAGNGQNDLLMIKEAALSIAVIDAEGCSAEVIKIADIVVRSTEDLLNLFLKPKRISATLRK